MINFHKTFDVKNTNVNDQKKKKLSHKKIIYQHKKNQNIPILAHLGIKNDISMVHLLQCNKKFIYKGFIYKLFLGFSYSNFYLHEPTSP